MKLRADSKYGSLTLREKQQIVNIPNPVVTETDKAMIDFFAQRYGVTKTTVRMWRRRIIEEVTQAQLLAATDLAVIAATTDD